MSDNIVNMTFDDKFDQGGQYSGNLNVDYANNQVTGTITVSIDDFVHTYQIVHYDGDSSRNLNEVGHVGQNTQYNFFAQQSPGSIGDGYLGIHFNWTGETPQTFDIVNLDYPDNNIYSGAQATSTGAPVQSTTVAVCLAAGCFISTTRGEVLVEELRIGDSVLTGQGYYRQTRWLGHRVVDCNCPDPQIHWPVRIAKDAVRPGVPGRDVLVSPGHAVCVTPEMDMMMRAIDLVNGASVAQVKVDSVTYWHVELDAHEIIFANGLPVESYLDEGNRDYFRATDGNLSFPPKAAGARCRPLVVDGEELEAARSRLIQRSFELGWTQRQEPMRELHVVCDGTVVSPRIEGECAHFDLPAGFGEVWLMSDASSPRALGLSIDARVLGIDIAALDLVGADGEASILLSDASFSDGFHELEVLPDGELRRWTNGRGRIPTTLLSCATGTATLRAKVRGGLPRWVAPGGLETQQ